MHELSVIGYLNLDRDEFCGGTELGQEPQRLITLSCCTKKIFNCWYWLGGDFFNNILYIHNRYYKTFKFNDSFTLKFNIADLSLHFWSISSDIYICNSTIYLNASISEYFFRNANDQYRSPNLMEQWQPVPAGINIYDRSHNLMDQWQPVPGGINIFKQTNKQ